MPDTIEDEIGRIFCKEHQRETCHECCMSFDPMNRMAEEQAGLRKSKTEVEKIAEEFALAEYALRGMEQMVPRPSQEVFAMNRKYLSDAVEKLKAFPPSEVAPALHKAREEQRAREIERHALAQGFSQRNPGQHNFEVGGPETQRLVDELLSKPVGKSKRAEKFTCAYCGQSSAEKLKLCSRCKKVSYCGKDCQKAAWKAHKKECIPFTAEKDPKSLKFTWDQVEAHQGAPALGRVLEVRAVLDESVMRQVFSCKDRVGVIRRVAAYTNSRKIPGLVQGSLLRWKNPRFHHFMDGSGGARIEEEDLVDVTIV